MIIFCSDFFKEHVNGGAELTTEALIEASLLPVRKVMSSNITERFLKDNQDKFWIFGNYSKISKDLLFYIAKSMNYAVIEYDYKYCEFRLPELHRQVKKQECDCSSSRSGKIASIFLKFSKVAFWMSQGQLSHHQEVFPFLKNHNNIVLSSVFSKSVIEMFRRKRAEKVSEKWGILGSSSWIKGTQSTIAYAVEKKLDFEILTGLQSEDFIRKLDSLRGFVFHPVGRDTCPRVVIEAKAMGCELDLNSNVQHKDEEWFSGTVENMLRYLESRPRVFWNEVEKVLTCLPRSLRQRSESTHFKIIVPFFNAERWVEKCIDSVKRQNYDNYQCILINDVSTDRSKEIVEKAIVGDDRFVLVNNSEKKYALRNICEAISLSEPQKEDVVVLLDGDDWLSCSATLSSLDNTYQERECWVTYGSYVSFPSGKRGVEPSEYSEEVVKGNLFRKDRWRASHLRTYKFKLWQQIKERDFIDTDGEFYKMAYDQAIMLPLLEMAGSKSHYVPEIMHVYNVENPLHHSNSKEKQQYETMLRIRAKECYSRRVTL